MRQYKRMTWDDRVKIEALYNAGHTYRFIAEQTGFTPAAVHYEVKRGLYTHLDWKTYDYVKRYSAQIAHDFRAGSEVKADNDHEDKEGQIHQPVKDIQCLLRKAAPV